MAKLFGTDGVRGVANEFLTPELTMKIGRAGAYALAGELGRVPKILVGTDTRLSADMLEAALVAGLCSVGAEVHRVRVVPSPAMAHLVRKYKMDAGAMLSASHNPMQDNGIKFFDSMGYKLSDEMEEKIESLIVEDRIPSPTGAGVGRCSYLHDKAVADYAEFVAGTTGPLTGMTVAIDCANGACCETAPLAFEKLGASVTLLHHKPNGININDGCGSTHLESIAEYVKNNPVDIGLAFDGDGDRVLCVDETGAEMDGDGILAVCGLALKKKGLLKNNAIVATVMSNLGLRKFCEREGIEFRCTSVGDRYVIQEMKAGGYNLGGEQSGHIILGDYNTTGDGILTGLQLLSILKESGQKLSELRKVMETLPQVLLSAELGRRLTGGVKENEKIARAIADIESRLGDSGRVLVRPSGTEPIVRVMIEGPDQAEIKKWASELVEIIEQELR